MVFGMSQSVSVIDNYRNLVNSSVAHNVDQQEQILTELTNYFNSNAHSLSTDQRLALADLLFCVMLRCRTELKIWLSNQLATNPYVPKFLIYCLALREIEIARPVLEYSRVLNENDLIGLIEISQESHKLAISRRANLTYVVVQKLLQQANCEIYSVLEKNRSVTKKAWPDKSDQIYDSMSSRDQIAGSY